VTRLGNTNEGSYLDTFIAVFSPGLICERVAILGGTNEAGHGGWGQQTTGSDETTTTYALLVLYTDSSRRVMSEFRVGQSWAVQVFRLGPL
jgi:hypothetical protein